MKHIKLYEDFKVNNQGGTLITLDDIINCIKNDGVIYATIISDFPDNDPEEPLNPLSVDDDGLVTIEYDGRQYEVKLDNIEKIENN
jgi:hypothetical protein